MSCLAGFSDSRGSTTEIAKALSGGLLRHFDLLIVWHDEVCNLVVCAACHEVADDLAITAPFQPMTDIKLLPFETSNPRELRALHALLNGPLTRAALDAAAGASNGPELVAALRRKGLDVPCTRVDAIDRDGRPCRPGVYRLTAADRARVASITA